ncbi:hypothetical protein V8E36_000217 [Tilletia maclaganii]
MRSTSVYLCSACREDVSRVPSPVSSFPSISWAAVIGSLLARAQNHHLHHLPPPPQSISFSPIISTSAQAQRSTIRHQASGIRPSHQHRHHTYAMSPSIVGDGGEPRRASHAKSNATHTDDIVLDENTDFLILPQAPPAMLGRANENNHRPAPQILKRKADGTLRTTSYDQSNGKDIGASRYYEPIPRRFAPAMTGRAQVPAVEKQDEEDVRAAGAKKYLGTFVLSGWSSVRGTSIIKTGDRISVIGSASLETSSSSSHAARSIPGKAGATPGTEAKPGANARFIPEAGPSRIQVGAVTKKYTRKKMSGNYIVRFVTESRLEVGRLPVQTASWAKKLLDHDLVYLDG